MKKISPYLKILLAFLFVILLFTLLLMIPFATKDGHISFTESLFTITSAVCVTGLSVFSDLASKLSGFGITILLFAMEIGALSFITIATYIVVIFGGKINLSNRFLLKEQLNQGSLKEIVKFVRQIILISFIVQLSGFALTSLSLLRYEEFRSDPGGLVVKSLFHTVAAFCNAGFDLFGNNSLINFSNDYLFAFITMFLIVFGGIGFFVIHDIIKKKRWKYFSLNTKIVILMTVILIVLGTFLLWLSNMNRSFLEVLFTSVSARTCGFTMIDMTTINDSEYLTILLLMFIGASPCSTGGGIKTITFFILLSSIFSYGVNKKTILFKREVPKDNIKKAFLLVVISVIFCFLITYFLTFSEKLSIRDLTFEVISAFGTTGFDIGIASQLSVVGRLLIVLTMFFGRVGPLTIVLMLNNKRSNLSDDTGINYVEEKVMIG